MIEFGATRLLFEALPHLEEEFAHPWVAQAMAEGEIRLPAPDDADAMLVPFVVQAQGFRFGKHPPGFPSVLTAGHPSSANCCKSLLWRTRASSPRKTYHSASRSTSRSKWTRQRRISTNAKMASTLASPPADGNHGVAWRQGGIVCSMFFILGVKERG